MKDVGKSNINSFFRNLLRDLVMLFQLFALLGLLLAIAQPYIEVPRTSLVDQTVMVIDNSASMSADNRFELAIKLANDNLGSENTIITINENPSVLAERVSASRAESELENLKLTDMTTALTSALQLASQYAAPGTRVVIVSDFIPSAGDLDFEIAADALESTGAVVDYLPVSGGRENVGIIDLLIGPVNSRMWIKNYNVRPTEVTLKISDAEQEILLGKGETREIEFKTPVGVAELEILENDDFMADNKAWSSTPEKNTISMMVLTNNKEAVEQSNFMVALDIIAKNFPTSFQIEYSEPPKIGALNHDIYVVYDASVDFILPGYVRDIQEKVSEGASLLVFSQEDMFSLEWQNLLPVEPAQSGDGGRSSIIPDELQSLTQDVQFGQVSSYFRVQATEDATIVAKTETDPLVALRREGRGIVFYYGINDKQSAFSTDPSYPIFWRRTFDLLTERPSLANLNVRTGSILALQKETNIKTPAGDITTNLLPIEHAGLYILPDRTIAANLVSDRESSIVAPVNVTASDGGSGEETVEEVPKELTRYLLWGAIIFLLLELLYVKFRGDF